MRLVSALAVASVLLAASAASASTCPESTNVISQCLCGKWGYYPRLRGAVAATDGGTTTFVIVREPNQKYQGPPDTITGPSMIGDSPDAAFLLFVGQRPYPEDALYVPPEERVQVEGRLPIVNEQVQCVSPISGRVWEIPYAIAIDAGAQPYCLPTLRDAGYDDNGCGPTCGCGTEPGSSPFWLIAIALVTLAAQVVRRGRRVNS